MNTKHCLIDDPGVFLDILENLNAYIYIKDMDGQYQYVNKKVLTLFGLDYGDILGKDDSTIFSLEDSDDLRVNDQKVLLEGLTIEEEERNIFQESGEERIYWSIKQPLFDSNKRISGMFGISIDISDRKSMENNLKTLAQTDDLTGLANRRYFLQMAEKILAQAKRYNNPCAILTFDLDHFKNINDKYGHYAGDEVLRRIGEACRKAVREPDITGRMGGEEFSILLPQTDLAGAMRQAERLRQSISDLKIDVKAQEAITTTISVGVAAMTPEDDLDSLLSRADDNLYKAKDQGRNRVCGDTACTD